jgi:ankyrin repeat protein
MFNAAAAAGYLDLLKELVALGGINVNEGLFEAAMHGHLNIVRFLIENLRANIHYNYDIAIRAAAGEGHYEIVKYLMSRGANFRAEQNFALNTAAAKGYLDIVKYILKHHDGRKQEILKTAAVSAIYAGQVDVVRYLLEIGLIVQPQFIGMAMYASGDLADLLLAHYDAQDYYDME